MTDANDWATDEKVGQFIVKYASGEDDGLSAEAFAQGIRKLIDKAKALVDAVGSDDTGKLIGGQWVAGNGGLLSRSTIAAADALRMELSKWK